MRLAAVGKGSLGVEPRMPFIGVRDDRKSEDNLSAMSYLLSYAAASETKASVPLINPYNKA